jgi:hypothetical protein
MGQQVTASGREQRRDWRYACEGSVSLYHLLTQRWFSGTIVDLSISGCLVRPDEPGRLQSGDVVEVSFSFYGYSIRVTGAIRHIRPDQSMGIEFRARNENTNQQIIQVMQRLAQEWSENKNSDSQA